MDQVMTLFRHFRLFTLILFAAITVSGCGSSKRPVLYPNAHLQAVGQAQAQRDIDYCMQFAATSGVSRHKDGEIAKKTVTGSAMGAAGAGTAALILGRNADHILAGAAGGAAAGMVKGGVDSTDMNPTFQRFVGRCLRERGYEVIGWE